MNNGFYGSLSKIQKVNFQFDRIFPNRAMMDQEAEFGYYIAEGSSEKLPPVFNGRYVLVDYHEGDVVDKTIRIGYKSGNTVVAAPGISFGDGEGVAINDGDRITVIGEYDENENYTPYDVPRLYEYPNLQTPITYTSNTNSADSLSTYEKNLMIDGQQYGNIGRGWDSTVWQKTYQNGKSTYIMIAELNAFNPTIAIAPDAPTEIPANPYVGTDSTLDFYRIHMQASPGIRIKPAEQLRFKEENGLNTLVQEDSVEYETFDEYFSDPSTIRPYSDTTGDIGYYNGLNSDVLGDLPLAIYYNKDGLNKHISKSDVDVEDSIRFELTGKSGKKYYNQNPNGPKETWQKDMYELSILLPSLGESVSKVYDLAYGGNRYYNTDGLHLYWNNPIEKVSNESNADFTSAYFADEAIDRGFRNTDIYWNSKQGIRLFKKEGGQRVFDQDGLNSLAGIINTAHDLMGMIIRDYEDLSLNDVKDWDPTKIYFVDGHYYYKAKKYSWEAYANNVERVNNPYQQVHFLPTNLIKSVGSSDSSQITLTDEINSSYVYFVDTAHQGSENNPQNVIYRESWEEYPEITDLESYDSDTLFKTKYVNYIKVKNENDLIDGAVYGIIVESNSSQENPQDSPEAWHDYFYYNTSSTPSFVRYEKETNLTYPRGIYYDLTNLQNFQVDEEFYIPNIFFVYDMATGRTRRASEASLRILNAEYDNTNPSNAYSQNNQYYRLYRKVTTGKGTPVAPSTDYEWKEQNVPEGRYTYENNKLKIWKDTQGRDDETDKLDEIGFLSATDVTNKQKVDTIQFDLNNVPIIYYTIQYTNSEGIDYWTKDELYARGLSTEEYNTPKYLTTEIEGSTNEEFMIPDPTTLVRSLKDFEEGKYFFLNGNSLILENANRLRTVQGQERNISHNYYDVNLSEKKVIFQTVGGSYYKTAEGDYKIYPVFHIKDPNESTLTGEGKPLYREVKQEGRPEFIPLGDINNFRVFKPNTYTYADGSLATEFVIDNNNPYFERIGNIVGNSEPDWADGMEWNEEELGTGMTLGQYSLDWEPKEIKGLGEEVNTMFGLILKINQMLEGDNKNTRDSNSVQGVLNQCKDMLAMMKSFGYSFNSFQVKDNEGNSLGNKLIANNPGDTIELISNNGLINLSTDNTESKQIKFNETVLNAEKDSINNITYLNVGDVNNNIKKPQIIEYSKNINANTSDVENIGKILDNNRETDLAFNANNVSFYGPNEELTRTEIKYFEPTVWTNPDPNNNTQWVFDTTGNSLTVNSSNLNFVLNLLSDVSSNRRTEFKGYSYDWPDTMILQGSLAEDLTSYTFSQANLDVVLDSDNTSQANITFSVELNAPLTDLPENGIVHTVKLTIYDSNNSNNVYYTTTENIKFVNNSTIFAIQDFSVNLNVLKNGKVNFVFDNNATLLTNSDSSQYNTETNFNVWNSSFIVIPGNNHTLALTDGEEMVYYQRNDFSFGTPGSPYAIGSSNNNTVSFASNPDGKKVVLSIDGIAIQTWNSFSMPVTPPPVKISEFKSTGQLNLYKGLRVNGSNRATHEGKPFVTSTSNYPLRFEWTPEIPTTMEESWFIPEKNNLACYVKAKTTTGTSYNLYGGNCHIEEFSIIPNDYGYGDNLAQITCQLSYGVADDNSYYYDTQILYILNNGKKIGEISFAGTGDNLSSPGSMISSPEPNYGYVPIPQLKNGTIELYLNNYNNSSYRLCSESFNGVSEGTSAKFMIYNDNTNAQLIKIEASAEE